MKNITLCLIFCVIFGKISTSAIPMWEFLSKQEKMSYLYSMFANQVEEYCHNEKNPNCNRKMLKYGLGKLKNFTEDLLDIMDPYQRNANKIIWENMLEGHDYQRNTPKKNNNNSNLITTQKTTTTTTTTPKPNSYEDQSFGDFGEASAKIDNFYRVIAPYPYNNKNNNKNNGNGFVIMTSGTPEYYIPPNNYQHNYKGQSEKQHNVGNIGGPYWKFNQFHENKYNNENPTTQQSFLPIMSGPMIVRVYPDGSPVKDGIDMPQDDDLRQYEMSKIQLPNI